LGKPQAAGNFTVEVKAPVAHCGCLVGLKTRERENQERERGSGYTSHRGSLLSHGATPVGITTVIRLPAADTAVNVASASPVAETTKNRPSGVLESASGAAVLDAEPP
jgi:hypothetical protein